MFGFSKTYMCPTCLEDLRKSDVQVCCDKNIDHVRPNTIAGKKMKNCKECDGHYTRLRCSKCGPTSKEYLPSGFLDFDGNIRFAMVAPSGAGKTCFITVMMEELKRARSLRLLPQCTGETKLIFEKNRKLLYDEHDTPETTTPGVVTPMIWKILDPKRGNKTTTPAYSMTIFDGAGEDLEKDRMDPTICRYLSKAKCIFLLLDPVQIETVRRNMTNEQINSASSGQGKSVKNIVGPLVEFIQEQTHTKVKQKINIPLAVIFCKIDVVKEKFESALTLQPSGHVNNGKFMISEADTVHNEIKGWLESQGEYELTDLLDSSFTNWRYFGVSAFGQPPVKGAGLNDIQPLRILDPLIWAMSLEKLIDISK